jgi:hypothetical protein
MLCLTIVEALMSKAVLVFEIEIEAVASRTGAGGAAARSR